MSDTAKIRIICEDWIEVTECKYAQRTDENTHRIRIRISQISEVVEYDAQDRCRGQCKVVMNNGNTYTALCDYNVICGLLHGMERVSNVTF